VTDAPPRWRSRNPWWIPPFLGRVPDRVSEAHVRVLGAIALAVVFENYDQAMLTQAVKQIAADFALAEADLGNLLGVVRLGAIPAFLLVPLADRVGRRRLFLASVLGMSLGTLLSAFARGAVEFVALQMLARMFMVTSSATAYVIVTEEFDAQHRGWGIGILGALGAFGVGLSALLFAAIDVLPFGWRAMYVLGVVPLVLLPWLHRRVPETERFNRHRADRGSATGSLLRGWWHPLLSLVRIYPERAAAVGVIGLMSSAGHAAAYNFSAYFVQVEHGWAPGHYSIMLLVAGTAGIIGHPFAGRVADRRGRRLVGFLFYGLFPLLALLFYRGPGWLLPVVWIPMVFTLTGGLTITRALSTELFPTSHRGTASGWLQLVETLGAAGGLLAVSWLTPTGESAIPAVEIMLFATLAAAGVVLLLPETGRRTLEEVSAER
jgi:MFS family permease